MILSFLPTANVQCTLLKSTLANFLFIIGQMRRYIVKDAARSD